MAVLWLKTIVTTHAAHMISHPNIREELAPLLSVIDAKERSAMLLGQVKGRLDLVTDQISKSKCQKQDSTDECLLVYQDQGKIGYF